MDNELQNFKTNYVQYAITAPRQIISNHLYVYTEDTYTDNLIKQVHYEVILNIVLIKRHR